MLTLAEQLKAACANGRAMHGLLITSCDPERAVKLILECAALLLFGNTDVEALNLSADYFKLDGTVKTDELREIRQELYKLSFSGGRRVVNIHNAHLLNDNAINAMLKMLEEPPEGTYFLLDGIEQRILPTIRSRCMIIRLGTTPLDEIKHELISAGASDTEAEKYAAMGMGITSRSLRLYLEPDFRLFRSNAVSAFIDMLLGKLPFDWARAIGKDREAARECVEFMFGVCHDLMELSYGGHASINIDFKDKLSNLALCFTMSQISSIINKLIDVEMRLSTNAGSNLTLDGMIVEISGICKTQVSSRHWQ